MNALTTVPMGAVWLADDSMLKRQVALKFLSINVALSDNKRQDTTEHFYREAQAAGRLSHRNIVIINDINEMDGRPFISVEYLKGYTLDQVIV